MIFKMRYHSVCNTYYTLFKHKCALNSSENLQQVLFLLTRSTTQQERGLPLSAFRLQLEEKQIPYIVEKINMRCYGPKPPEFMAKVNPDASTEVLHRALTL